MKNAKRWLAVILAVTLLGSNAVYQLGTTLSANETEAVTESQQDESENAVAEQAEKQQEDTGKACTGRRSDAGSSDWVTDSGCSGSSTGRAGTGGSAG